MDLKASRNEATGRWTLEGVEPSEVTFERICKMLKEGENFKFARYGDGEFNCMFGKFGQNCDGHEYFPALGTALNDAFYSDPSYMVGIQPLAVQSGMWEKAIQREGYPKNIYDADVLHSASIDGKITDLFKACEGRPIVLVGPQHLSTVPDIHIRVSRVNCWQEYDAVRNILEHTLNHLDPLGQATTKPIVFLCCSMMAEVLIDEFQFRNCTIIDCGSVFDPYWGVKSRRYHHKPQTQWTLEKR